LSTFLPPLFLDTEALGELKIAFAREVAWWTLADHARPH
jgi:hypothetical protein